MPAPPRLITHRPDLLRLTSWAYRDGVPWLAAWLDASEAVAADWHDPELVLIDAQCRSMMSLLYGDRAGPALVVGLTEDGPRDGRVARLPGSAQRCLRVDRPLELDELVEHLARFRHPTARTAIARPALRLVAGGRDASASPC